MPHDDFNGNGHPALHPPDHTAILLDQTQELRRQSHQLGWIVGRLETGDQFHKEVKSDLVEIKGRLKSVEERPHQSRDLGSLIESVSKLIKESWPFAALLAGAAAKATGSDLSVVSKLLGH